MYLGVGGRSEMNLFLAHVALSAWDALALAVAILPRCYLVVVDFVI